MEVCGWLASTQIFFQGHCRFYFYFIFIFPWLPLPFFKILPRLWPFEGRVDCVRAHPRLRARLGGSEDAWWAFGEAVCVGASS